jgi:phenylpropionate dioxygenase-like ring-hydroxylating dioxygenase large terminal subunit
MDAPAALPDFHALRRCWHPAAFSSQLGTEPLAVTLLGERLVVYRDSAGTPHALSDLCIHRGTALSLGAVIDDELRCPYHGWRYGPDGVCRAIPQLADPSKVPSKARVAGFHCQERYGIVWIAMDDPRWPLPEVPELESADFMRIQVGPHTWDADASRQLENFTDFGHFAWVHPGLLGDPDHPVIPHHVVETKGHVLRYDYVRPEAAHRTILPRATHDRRSLEKRSRYWLQLPYTIVLRFDWGGEEQTAAIFASQPVDRDRCSGYLMIGRNWNMDEPAEVQREFEDTVFNQDKRVVESQRPDRVPFDLAAELHMKFDVVAVSYRKAMRDNGLATSTPPGAESPGGAGRSAVGAK